MILKCQTQLTKARDQQQQQQEQKPQQNNQMQMQKLLLQRHVLQQQQQQHQQQQQRDGTQVSNATSNGLASNEPLMRQNPATANSLAAKMYEEKLKLPPQRDDDAAFKVIRYP